MIIREMFIFAISSLIVKCHLPCALVNDLSNVKNNRSCVGTSISECVAVPPIRNDFPVFQPSEM